MKLGTIKAEDGSVITIGTSYSSIGRILIASNGDDVHPHSRPYQAGRRGTAQAARDCVAMWGGGNWDLALTPQAERALELPVIDGYKRD